MPYGHEWRTETRPRILARDGYECVRCGMPDRSSGLRSALDVAHLDGDNTHDGEDDNLATLCRRCHRAHDYTSWARKFGRWLREKRVLWMQVLDAGRGLLKECA